MGTRADFYVGRGTSAEWLGSIAWDGYPEGHPKTLLQHTDEQDWRTAVADLLARRDDSTLPAQGWPWPWENSLLTDYSYAFDDGAVYVTCFGYVWWKATDPPPGDDDDAEPREKSCVFPEMSTQQMAEPGSHRSGVMVFRV